MKILITGSNGFIGKNVIEQLSFKYTFLPVKHKETNLSSAKELGFIFDDFKPDAVIHCATKPGHKLAADKTDLTLTNLLMFAAIDKCVKDFNVKKFISIGSGSEFAMTERNLDNVTEEEIGEVIPNDETGFPRYIINSLIKLNKNAVNLRCFGVFGKYEEYKIRFISYAVVCAVLNKDIIINQNKKFSFIFIDDLVKIIDKVLNSAFNFSDYNVTPDYIYTMEELALLVQKICNPKINIKILGTGFNYTGSNKRLSNEFGISFTKMETAIQSLYEYYSKIKNELILLD